MLTRRLQVLLDEERYDRVAALAKQRHISVAEVIRHAIDRGPATPPRRRAAAARLARAYADLFAPLLVVEETDLHDGLQLFERHAALGCFDAILAAAARSIGATALVSADAAFGVVPRLNHVVPDVAGVGVLLAAG